MLTFHSLRRVSVLLTMISMLTCLSVLSAGVIKLGMDEVTLIELLGKPTKRLGTADKSLLYWDSAEVTLKQGKVVKFEEKKVPAKRPPNDLEWEFLSAAREMQKDFNHGIVKPDYIEAVAAMEAAADKLKRSGEDKLLLVRINDYVQIHHTLVNIWNTEAAFDEKGQVVALAKAGPYDRRVIYVLKEKNPVGFRLIEDAFKLGRFRPVNATVDSFQIESVYGLWDYTEWRYWNPIESRLRELNIEF